MIGYSTTLDTPQKDAYERSRVQSTSDNRSANISKTTISFSLAIKTLDNKI